MQRILFIIGFDQYVQMNYKASYFQHVSGLIITRVFQHFKLLTDSKPEKV